MKPQSIGMLLLFVTLLPACAAPIASTSTPAPEVPSSIAPTGTPTQNEDAAIYAAAIRQIVTIDNSFGDTPPAWTTLYLISTTDDSVTNPVEAAHTPIPEDTRQAIAHQLTDLPYTIVWIASNQEAPIADNGGLVDDGQAVVITLGAIRPQEDESAQVFVWLYCANLCAIGKTYILEQVNGSWQVTGDAGPTIMS